MTTVKFFYMISGKFNAVRICKPTSVSYAQS